MKQIKFDFSVVERYSHRELREENEALIKKGKRRCSKCRSVKPLDKFYEWNRGNLCKDCINENQRKSKDKHKKACIKCGKIKGKSAYLKHDSICNICMKYGEIDSIIKSGSKKCTKCGITKDISEFRKSGYGKRCKKCRGIKHHNQKSAKILGKRRCTICGELKDISDFRVKSYHCFSCRPKSQLRIKVEENKNLFQQGKRRCSRCKIIKSLDDFGRDKHRTHGYSSYCLECIREYYRSSQKHIKHKEEITRLKPINKEYRIHGMTNTILEMSMLFRINKNIIYNLSNDEFLNLLNIYNKKYRMMVEKEGKVCTKCGVWKEYKEFNKAKTMKDGRRSHCKECQRNYKEGMGYNKCECGRKKCISSERCYRCYRIEQYINKNKRINSPKYKLNTRIAAHIRRGISKKNIPKNSKTWDLLSFSLGDLMKHLESKFIDGMSWDNMNLWHIDHIRPISSFNYTSPDDPEFKKCWSLSNLQPLWAEDNIRKGSKMLD